MPSPGDIRRMFGNDTIDCEPEYARGMDPDWSRVSPTTPAELESNIRQWNAATNAVLRSYRDREENRRRFDKKNKLSKKLKRTCSEGDKGKNSRSKEQRSSNPGTHTLKKKHWRNWPREPECMAASSVKSVGNGDRQTNLPNNSCTGEFLTSDGKAEPERIPYSPKKITLKSYNTAIRVVQKMKSNHWILIDKLYNEIKREKGINIATLKQRVVKIVREIYGNDSEFILSTIHSDPVQRVIKLGKLMLNVYHEAMFGSKKKQKLLVPGINNQHFARKCLQAYTFTPHYRTTTRMTSKMYEKLTASREKPLKCTACFRKNMEKENTLQRKLGSCFSSNHCKQMKKKTNFKPNRKGSERLAKSNFTKLNNPNGYNTFERRKEESLNGFQKNNNVPKSQMMLYIPPFMVNEQFENYGFDESKESNLSFPSNEEKSLDEMEKPPHQDTSLEIIEDNAEDDQTLKSSTGNMGGGDSLVQFSNDYNYLLSSLYESTSNISLELSKKLSASPIMATFGDSVEQQDNDLFFTSTANILQLNDQLEKMLFKETCDESSRSFQDPSSDSDDEYYIDCESTEDQMSSLFTTNNEIKVQKNYYKYSK